MLVLSLFFIAQNAFSENIANGQNTIFTGISSFFSGNLNIQNNIGGPTAEKPILLGMTQNNAVISTASPLSEAPESVSEGSIIIYEIEKGDTLGEIADKFNISINTIKYANNLKSNALKIGTKLEILPVSGVKHTVKSGDTINAIAKKYQVDPQNIIDFNALPDNGSIAEEDVLIIPGAEISNSTPITLTKPKINSSASQQNYSTLPKSYFSAPVNGYRSQGLHRYNAVDIATDCGQPVFASARGKVIEVDLTISKSSKANGGYGNYIKIMHPNGVITNYTHLLKSFVEKGETVDQNQKIALVGGEPGAPGSGKSTGCHLHFEVRGAKNPFASGPATIEN